MCIFTTLVPIRNKRKVSHLDTTVKLSMSLTEALIETIQVLCEKAEGPDLLEPENRAVVEALNMLRSNGIPFSQDVICEYNEVFEGFVPKVSSSLQSMKSEVLLIGRIGSNGSAKSGLPLLDVLVFSPC